MSNDVEVGLGDTPSPPEATTTAEETPLQAGGSVDFLAPTHHVVVNPEDHTTSTTPSLMVQADSARAPASLLCHTWHPTQAVLRTKDGADGEEGAVTFHWDARAHRKLRFVQAVGDDAAKKYHPLSLWKRLSLWSWEPRIITWYNLLIGIVANTLWVVNGVYATWPEEATKANPENVSFATGVVGAFLFIITGYLGYVEALNQTHAAVRVPTSETTSSSSTTTTNKRGPFRRPQYAAAYGKWKHPLSHSVTGAMEDDLHHLRLSRLTQRGYPLVKDVETGQYVTEHLLHTGLDKYGEKQFQEKIVGRPLEIVVHGDTLRVTVDELLLSHHPPVKEKEEEAAPQKPKQGYRWWTWAPDLHYIGVFSALVFFVCTIIFFIPAVAWLPMGNHDPSLASTIFWDYILQIIPSVGFIFVGFAAMAEASGSWIRPHNSIGWYASLCNTIGGFGFLLYPILYLPAVVGEPDCCDELSKWGASLATFWGSCAFWIAGILQWIEFCSQHRL